MEFRTERLVMVGITPAVAQGIVSGSGRRAGAWHPEYPFVDELDPLRELAVSESGVAAVFGMYMIRTREEGLAVGGIGFFGPPGADGRVELGYGLVEAVRGRGLATEAVRGAVDFAGQHGVFRVEAGTTPENALSQRVLAKAGFVEVSRDAEAVQFALTGWSGSLPG